MNGGKPKPKAMSATVYYAVRQYTSTKSMWEQWGVHEEASCAFFLCRITTTEENHELDCKPVAVFQLDTEAQVCKGYLEER